MVVSTENILHKYAERVAFKMGVSTENILHKYAEKGPSRWVSAQRIFYTNM